MLGVFDRLSEIINMEYDHNNKAGNEGDIVKHVALIAALGALLHSHEDKVFKYVDIYSGYAFNPIVKTNEWKNGVKKIYNNRDKISDKNVELYYRWYLSRPSLVSGIYPGSSLIALDTITFNGFIAHLTLFDISNKVLQNLYLAYDRSEHKIFDRASNQSDSEIQDADFIFVDPPGLYSNKKLDYPNPEDLLKYDNQAKTQNILIWLPITISTKSTPPKESKPTLECIELFRKSGYQVTKIRWAIGGRVVGCFMAYRMKDDAILALQKSIVNMVEITNWKSKIENPVEHLEAMS